MELGDKVNWLITSRCNLSCGYCPVLQDGDNEKPTTTQRIAEELSRSKVRGLSISGGEPMLVKDLSNVIKGLHSGGKYVSLHTNGHYLNAVTINSINQHVDGVAIPLDSMNPAVNDRMRGSGSLEAAKSAINILKQGGIKTRIHTVATPGNINGLNEIYYYFSEMGLDHWKIYEMMDRNDLFGDYETAFGDGGVNSFFADFLLAEEAMRAAKDDRVEFVALHDRRPYIFLDPLGNVNYGPWFFDNAKSFGNILSRGLDFIVDNVKGFVGSDSEQLFEGMRQLPLWARYYNGEFDPEEVAAISPEYKERFERLVEVYMKRDACD